VKKQSKKIILLLLPIVLLPLSNLIPAFGIKGFNIEEIMPSLVGAITEEVFFRWLLLKTILLPHIKSKPAIFYVSILFASMHLFNLRNGMPFPNLLIQMLCAFCFSIWAGAVVWRKGSILIPILAHVLLNLTAVTEGTLIPLAVSVVVLADGILLMKGNENEQ